MVKEVRTEKMEDLQLQSKDESLLHREYQEI